MPQPSLSYAMGRMALKRHDRLKPEQLDRLVASASFDEAQQMLATMGWPQTADTEQAAFERVREAYKLVGELSVDSKLTDCFLLRYDINNLKLLIKARALNTTDVDTDDMGLLPPATLARQVAARRYQGLPKPLLDALKALEARLALSVDPLDIDVSLDRAYFATVFDWLKGAGHKALRRYFEGRVDLINLITLFRVKNMQKPPQFAAQLLISGGAVDLKALQKAFDRQSHQQLVSLYKPYGAKLVMALVATLDDASRLPLLERAADEALTAETLAKQEDPALQLFVGYLIMREREAAAVRLVLAAKKNGFGEAALKDRLRKLYV